MKIATIKNINPEHRLFEVASKISARSYYQVRIGTQPSCSCPDFNKFGSKVNCKHILFVLVFGLDVTDVKLLDSRSFQADQIKEILMKTDISEEFKMGKRKKENQIRRQKAGFQRILDSHTQVNDPQVFTHAVGRIVKKVITIGSPCIKVDGALTVPYEKD